MQTRERDQVSVPASLPPRFPQFRRPEILQIVVEVVGVELQIRRHVDSHRPRSKLDEPRWIGGSELLPSLPASALEIDRKSTRLNSSHVAISYAVLCLKNKSIPFLYWIFPQSTKGLIRSCDYSRRF